MLTQKEKQSLSVNIRNNKQQVFIISFEEMESILKTSIHWQKQSVKDAWQKIRIAGEVGAGYYSTVDDMRTLAFLMGELGAYGLQAYVKVYKGKPHIILKGHSGLRTFLTGTRYGAKNAKVITLGLGKAGAINAAKAGGVISIVLMTSYRVIDFFLTDNMTLSQLFGALATDIVKIGITVGASIAAAAVVGTLTTIAVAPLIAVIVVGVFLPWAFDYIESKYKITDRVVKALDELSDSAKNHAASYEQMMRHKVDHVTHEVVDSAIDYMVGSAQKIILNFAKHKLNQFTSIRPRFL